MEQVSWAAALLAGLVTFFSPCILPTIPSYLVFITGVSLSELTAQERSAKIRRTTIINTIGFILGFSLVYVFLGAMAGKIGSLLRTHMDLISKIGGVIIIIFGLYVMGVLRLAFLTKHAQIEVARRPAGYIGSFVVGIAFAAGWTPCAGPMIGTLIAMAGQSATMGRGIYLLCFYSLGLAIPFLLTAVAVDTFLGYFSKLRKHMQKISIGAGILLIIIGVAMFMGWLSYLPEYFAPDFDEGTL